MKLSWNEWYNLAKQYYEHHGDLMVMYNFKTKNGYDYDEDGHSLGLWIRNQRYVYSNESILKNKRIKPVSLLNQSQIELLESIGMVFNTYEFNWNNWYNLAKKYFEHHGDLMVPSAFKTKNGYDYDEEGENLGNWISNQRTAYWNSVKRANEITNTIKPLTQTRIELLESIGMVFNAHESNWNNWYNLAKEYYKHYGNLSVPLTFKTKNGYDYDEEGKNLGNWISNQQIAYRNAEKKQDLKTKALKPLTESQIKLLESIGMVFNSHESNWNNWYNLAKEYYKHYGNLSVPLTFKTKNGYDYDEEGKNLGYWINNQRKAYDDIDVSKDQRKYNLNPLYQERIELLESIGMIFSNHEFNWNSWYNLAKEYYKHYGNLLVPSTFKTKNGYDYDEEGKKLGNWINNQRKAYENIDVPKDQRKNNAKPLDQRQVELLESIGMIFSIKNNKKQSSELCELFDLDYKKYSYLIRRIPYRELNAKINYLIDNNMRVLCDESPNEIFFMSDINMQTVYGISKKELIEKYYKPKNEKGKVKCF